MNGNPTGDVDVFIKRLSLLRVYEDDVKRFVEEIQDFNSGVSTQSLSSNWGISVPYGEEEIIDGKKVTIMDRNIFIPNGCSSRTSPNLRNFERIDELETMIIQYNTEINYLKDTLDICSDIVSIAALRIYADGENQETVANDIHIDRGYLIRKKYPMH